ncbi:hypothetical protein L195_g044699 [Trifolium pratense]|uniref:RNase H type-1 domain-containing protein n=1 Tax=Trifolium pratense TaxID=57577 RepID=A0A2K3MCS7_TRIPR|nr:hypothetical protein L195_g044699 [Trifolium pratense]
MPISDVHWTTPPGGYYDLNVDAAGPIERCRWGFGVVVRDEYGVVVAASCWQVLSLSNSEVKEAVAMRKGLEFAKDMSFLNVIVESDASNVILTLNHHQQSFYYVGSIIEDCCNSNVFVVV